MTGNCQAKSCAPIPACAGVIGLRKWCKQPGQHFRINAYPGIAYFKADQHTGLAARDQFAAQHHRTAFGKFHRIAQ